MKNIIRVIRSDARHLVGNMVAIVITIGLGIIPALYAWFNIMSNWDPYGKDATFQMHIAVFSHDEGVDIGDIHLSMGDKVKSGLETNDTIGWVFTDSEDEALEGVYNSDYYAAFVIPEDFTEDMLSFLNGDAKNPQIEYYENSKKNAIATKITSKVKTTVQQSVNSSVISSLTEVASKTGELVTGENGGTSLVTGVNDKLKDMDKNLGTYVSVLNALSLVTDSATDLVGSTRDLLPSVEGLIDGSQSSVAGMQGAVLAGGQTAQTLSNMINVSMSSISNQLGNLKDNLELIDLGTDSISGISMDMDSLDQLAESTFDALSGLGADSDKVAEAKASYEQLSADMRKFQQDRDKTTEDMESIKSSIVSEIKTCQKMIENLKSEFTYKIEPNIGNSVYEIESALIQTQLVLASLDDSFPQIDEALEEYASVLEGGTDDVIATRDYISQIQDKLQQVISGLDSLTADEQYQEVVKLLGTDPEMIASFVTSPVAMETVPIYPIEHYGSAMAPFYTVLALWVGGLIMVALIHVKVKKNEYLGDDIKGWQKFFGRYFIFFFIGQIQTLITVLGNLFFVEIDCAHPFLFWLSSAIISFVFTFFMYALTCAFGNVGQAIAVVVMVIQVAGAGGTFPVEVLPDVYRAVYKFLPFTYSLNALRECVAGLYRFDLLIDLGILMIFVVLSVIIGLFCGRPFAKMHKKIEESKEKSQVLM